MNGYKSGFHDDFKGKTITLSSNIDSTSLARFIWVPIGTHDTPFLGNFDGKKHSISGIIMDSLSQNAALFGYNQGTIKNVNVDKSLLSGSWVAGIAVHNYGTIDSCLVNAKIYTMMGGAGIAVHNGLNAKVANSEFVGSGSFSAKSLVWEIRDSLNLKWIFNSAIKGFISGGIVGLNDGSVQNVVSRGDALFELYCTSVGSYLSDYGKGMFYYGGIVGYNAQSGIIKSAESRTEMKFLQAPLFNCQTAYINNFAVANIVGYNAGIVERVYSNADSLNVGTCNIGRVAGVVGINASSGLIDKALTKTALYATYKNSLCETSASGIVGKNDGTVKNSGSMGNIYVVSYDSYASNSYSGVVAGIASKGNGKIYNSFNVGNLLCKDSTGKNGDCFLYGLGLNNYFSNAYNYGNMDGPVQRKYLFGRGIDAYNSYAIEGSADSVGYKITDSYIYNSDAAMGLEDMTYYNMEDGEEVQGTLLEALNHWVQYRADNLGETYVAWKQGEKYPELDIEWNAASSVSSSSVESSSSQAPASSSSSDVILSSSDESSSSSVVASSSSEKYSSSKVESSSSVSPPSSSSEKLSSSSVVSSSSFAMQGSSSSEVGSSSSTQAKSSSSEELPTVVRVSSQKTFNLAVNGMTVTLSNTQGGNVRIFDALGHLVATKPLSATGTTSVILQTSGNYIVRINECSQMVNVRKE